MTTKRTKGEMFDALLTDAVASTYRAPGVEATPALTIDQLPERMDAAGHLEDCADDGGARTLLRGAHRGAFLIRI